MEELKNNKLVEDSENQTRPSSSCSVWTIFILLIIILLFFVSAIFYVKYKVINNIHFSNPVSWDRNLKNQIEQSARINVENGSATVAVSEDDLAQIIKIQDPSFPLKKASLKINSDKIIISGKTGTSFLSPTIDVGLTPKVEDSGLKFNIAEIKMAGFAAPPSIANMISSQIPSFLNGSDALSSSITITSASLKSGFLVLAGTPK